MLDGLPSEQCEAQVTKLNGALYMVIHMVRTNSYSHNASMLQECLLHTQAFMENRTATSLLALEEQEKQEAHQAGQVAGLTGGRKTTEFNSPHLQSLAPSFNTRVGDGECDATAKDGEGYKPSFPDFTTPLSNIVGNDNGPLVIHSVHEYSPSVASPEHVHDLLLYCKEYKLVG